MGGDNYYRPNVFGTSRQRNSFALTFCFGEGERSLSFPGCVGSMVFLFPLVNYTIFFAPLCFKELCYDCVEVKAAIPTLRVGAAVFYTGGMTPRTQNHSASSKELNEPEETRFFVSLPIQSHLLPGAGTQKPARRKNGDSILFGRYFLENSAYVPKNNRNRVKFWNPFPYFHGVYIPNDRIKLRRRENEERRVNKLFEV